MSRKSFEYFIPLKKTYCQKINVKLEYFPFTTIDRNIMREKCGIVNKKFLCAFISFVIILIISHQVIIRKIFRCENNVNVFFWFHNYSITVSFFQVDVDECEDIAVEYNISSMPTFVFIKRKETITSFSGANYDKLKALVLEHK